jgi:hypothetical protein
MKTSIPLAIGLSLVLSVLTHAQDERFIGLLDGLQENPPVATPASGTGRATYDPLTQMLTVTMSYAGLVAPTTDSHIHCCATSLTTNAGVAIGFTGAGGFVTGSTSGDYSHTFDLSQAATYNGAYFAASGGTVELARDRLLNAMRVGVANDPLPGDTSIAYFNIHTSFRPGGEIRGNIVPFVPEPSAALLMLLGLAPMAMRRHTR